MLSLLLVALGLVPIRAYAKPTVRAVGGLEISLSTPTDKVAFVSDLRVVAAVKNVGDEDLKILKSGTVLDDEHPTRSFIISKDGKEVPFAGITGSGLTDHLSASDWVIIPAGKTVAAEHNVSAMYDFSAAGPGTFTLYPVPRFQVVGPNNIIEANTADTRSVSITVTNGVLRRELDLGKRDPVVCSNSQHAQYISDSVKEAKSLISAAAAYIADNSPKNYLYKDYFGSNDPSGVRSVYNVIVDRMGPIPLDCSDSSDRCKGAYSFLADGKVYFCDAFFAHTVRLDLTCDDTAISRGGTVIREVAHALGVANEYATGCDKAKGLDDHFNVRNAGNFECFALEVFRASNCAFLDKSLVGRGI